MTNYSENIYFFNKDISTIKIMPNSLEHAYLTILDNDLDAAFIIFSNIDSTRASWGKIIVKLLKTGVLEQMPTFFQIRNFFEIDLDYLLRNQKIGYVEMLLGALEVFSSINQEVYKYAGRVMYENKLYVAALKYMDEAKKIYYNDPELHYMLAKYYLEIKNVEEAYFYINECIKLLPSYYPAQVMKNEIEELYN